MALFYNLNGTVSEVIVNYINSGSGAVTSNVTPPTIQQSFEASASQARYMNAVNANSSSKWAYEFAYPNAVRTNAGNTYLSSATIKKNTGVFVQYPFPTGSAPSGSSLLSNGVLVSSSQQAAQVLYGDGLNHLGTNYGVTSYTFNVAWQSATFASASLSDLLSQSQYSQSISLGRIVKISIPTSIIKSSVEKIKTTSDVQKLVISSSNGIVESISSFNYITDNTAVFFASASKNDMGSVTTNDIVFIASTQRLNSETPNRNLGVYIENGILVSGSAQAFEAKYPTNKSDWSLINGKLTSPKNQ